MTTHAAHRHLLVRTTDAVYAIPAPTVDRILAAEYASPVPADDHPAFAARLHAADDVPVLRLTGDATRAGAYVVLRTAAGDRFAIPLTHCIGLRDALSIFPLHPVLFGARGSAIQSAFTDGKETGYVVEPARWLDDAARRWLRADAERRAAHRPQEAEPDDLAGGAATGASIPWLLHYIGKKRVAGMFHAETDTQRFAVGLRDGKPVFASAGQLEGESALAALTRAERVRWDFDARAIPATSNLTPGAAVAN